MKDNSDNQTLQASSAPTSDTGSAQARKPSPATSNGSNSVSIAAGTKTMHWPASSSITTSPGSSLPAFAITAGSTDTAGSFTITAGNGTPGVGIAGQLVFDTAYPAAPKMVVLTSRDADGTNNAVYISAAGTTSFEVSFNTALSASEVVDFYYMVIE